MRTVLLIAAAGLTALIAGTPVARAQFYPRYYGWAYPRPYYVVPYGYYPPLYYAPPPPVYEPPPWRYEAAPAPSRSRYRVVLPRHRVVRRVSHRTLANPLLGPLPGATTPRRY